MRGLRGFVGIGAAAVLIGGALALPARAAFNGELQWARSVGGAVSDVGRGVAVDPTGATTVTDYFSGSARFGTGPDQTTLHSSGGADVLITRYRPDCTLAWAHNAGGTSDDIGYGVVVDPTGVMSLRAQHRVIVS